MVDNAQFIIKDDKYSFSIINKDTKRGISIFKKTLELNKLNEDNISMILKNTEKENMIYSYANIGFISITGLMCFAYCNEKDIKEIGMISSIKIYQVNNIRYIILDPELDQRSKNETLDFFQNYTKYEVNKNLFFAENIINFDLSFDTIYHHIYYSNTNFCHINPNLNYCYNYDYMAYFRKFNLEEFTTHLISGFYYKDTIKKSIKDNLNIHLIIKDKELNKLEENKNKIILKQIEIILSSNSLESNQIFHFIFYSYIGEFMNDIKMLYYLLKEGNPKNKSDNGSVIIIDIKNKTYGKSKEESHNYMDSTKKAISDEIGVNNKIIFIQQTEEINSLIEKNKSILDEIKYNFEFKQSTLQYQLKQLLIISDNEMSSINIIDSILCKLKYIYLNENGQLVLKNQDEINEYIKKIMPEYRNLIKTKNENAPKIERLYSEPVNDEYLNKYVFKERNKEKKEENQINDNLLNKNNNKISEDKNNEKNNIISIYIVTNNIACYNLENDNDSDNTLKKLLFPSEFHKHFSENNFPLFYCIGLQEIVKLKASNIILKNNKSLVDLWEKEITQLLQKTYNYTLQFREHLVGILFLFFVKTSEAINIKEIKSSVIKAGFLNKLGNKGYISYEFQFKNKKFAFCSGHFPSGEKDKNIQKRENILMDILNHKNSNNSNKIYENDYYFIFGDMNFRVKADHKKFFEQIERINSQKGIFDKMIKKDEDNIEDGDKDIGNLTQRKIDENLYKNYFLVDHWENEEFNSIKKNYSKYQIDEHLINFLPTYKYIIGYNSYNVSKKIPSWCDRILFKKNTNIKCLYYDTIDDIKYSDHRPVYALFEINLNI